MPTARRKKKKTTTDYPKDTPNNTTNNTTNTNTTTNTNANNTTVAHEHEHESDHEQENENHHGLPVEKGEYGRPGRRRVLSVLVGLGLVGYLVFFCSAHSEEPVLGNGAWDVLYLSNLVVLIAALGMLFRNPLIIGISISCVSYTHLCWFFDVFYWIAFNTWQVGRAQYLEEEKVSHVWPSTMHHAWFLWVCMTVLYVDYPRFGIPLKAWMWSLVVFAGMALLSWFGGKNAFMTDLVTGHEFWRNTELGYNTEDPLPIYLGKSLLVEGLLLNSTCFIFLKFISLLLLEDLKERLRNRNPPTTN
eukprot:TRINITY_DN7795_c0_g1_i1.p1 TRINITY_DN7795_c0_g1~~TRINITY_DN7795_c0_g1_i1.p1  ORF type:complete len:303 (-),score=62.50 TRINITY_DN7795_c0_g1_i1:31-939(-)